MRGRVSRREFLGGASACVLGAGHAATGHAATGHAAAGRETAGRSGAGNSGLLDLSAEVAIREIAGGALKAEAYAGALLERCAGLRALNAFITLDPALVLEQAHKADLLRASGAKLGHLHGLPIPVKDSVNTADYPTTAGTPALKGFRPKTDAPLVAALRTAGAIVLGKTNLHELSFGWTSNNLAFGAVHNPYDPTRIPGGSSGGTAAAVAAHMAPLGLAEDTEGSIRVPAALCGIMGFRPTTGRYSTAGTVPACSLFDQLGPEARCVGDLVLFDRVASGDPREIGSTPLQGVRLAIWPEYWFSKLDPDVARITEAALAKLRAAGARIVEAEVPELRELIAKTADVIVDHDTRVELTRYLADYGAPVSFAELAARASPDVRAIFEHEVLRGSPGFVSEPAYRTAVDVYLPKLRETFKAYFARTGAAAIVFPTTLVTAPRIGEEGDLDVAGRKVAFDEAVGRNIAPGSRSGLPGLVMPTGMAANGLPVSMELDGPAESDRALLALGRSIERVLGHVPPPRI